MSEQAKIEQAIAALEAQRSVLGDEVIQTTLDALRANLAELDAGEKRSLLTILFADITGFTAISESLDAEELQDIMGQFWANLDQIILNHNGQIDKHMGDRVMGVWGLEQAREEDPEQAVRAALAIQADVTQFRQVHGTGLSIRIGINTGLASIGHISSTGERNIIGDTVNLAARLERAAPNDGILISQPTYEQVRGLFEVQEQEPLVVKGKSEPVQSYRVLHAQERAFQMETRGLAGIRTRTVGREVELALLQSTFQQACKHSKSQWITVSGEAGVGKSRLLNDLEQWLQALPEKPQFFKARAWPQTTQSPYYLLRNLFAYRCEIRDSDPLAVAREKLTSWFTGVLDPETGEKAAALIGQLIGFDFSQSTLIKEFRQDSKQIQKQAERILRQNLGRIINGQPCVILLEDLQWADEQSLNLLAAIFGKQHAWPLTVVGAARPLLQERKAPWGTRAPHHQEIHLGALAGHFAGELVSELLQKIAQPPHWLVQLLVERGGGNPYFTEELVKWLVEQGMIQIEANVWQAHTEQPRGLIVPGTVQGVLQTRLERLKQKERATLQQAAVVGMVFWSGAVAYVGQEQIPAERWHELEQRNLILPQASSQLPGEEEFHFKHSLLRDVAYEYTLKKQRQILHKRAAEWLSQVAAERANEWAAIIAGHCQQANETDLAAEWYERAGQQAWQIYELETAINYFQKALDLLTPARETQAEPTAKTPLRLQLFQGLGDMLRLEAQFAEAARAFTGMLAAAILSGDKVAQTNAWRKAFLSLEDAKAALTLDSNILDLEDAQQSRQLNALELNLLGAIYHLLGNQEKVDPYMESSLSLISETDYWVDRDAAAAAEHFEYALGIARQINNIGGEMLCLTNLGRALINLNQHDSAKDKLLPVLRIAEKVEWFGIAETHRLLAEVLLVQEQSDLAAVEASQALLLAQTVRQPTFIGRAWRTLGKIAAQSDSPLTVNDANYDAKTCFTKSEQALKETGTRVERAFTLEAWANYETEHGDPQRGAEMRQKAQIMLNQLGIHRRVSG